MVIKKIILRLKLFWSTVIMRRKTPEPKNFIYEVEDD